MSSLIHIHALIQEGLDCNGDGHISHEEAEAITYLDIAGNWDAGLRGQIKSMIGIEAFRNLGTLRCHYNQISRLDVSRNRALSYLRCNENQITHLDVSGCHLLVRLDCDRNQLSSLDGSNLLFCAAFNH